MSVTSQPNPFEGSQVQGSGPTQSDTTQSQRKLPDTPHSASAASNVGSQTLGTASTTPSEIKEHTSRKSITASGEKESASFSDDSVHDMVLDCDATLSEESSVRAEGKQLLRNLDDLASESGELTPETGQKIDEMNTKLARLLKLSDSQGNDSEIAELGKQLEQDGRELGNMVKAAEQRSPVKEQMDGYDRRIENDYQNLLQEKMDKYPENPPLATYKALKQIWNEVPQDQKSKLIKRHTEDIDLVLANQKNLNIQKPEELTTLFLFVQSCRDFGHEFDSSHIETYKELVNERCSDPAFADATANRVRIVQSEGKYLQALNGMKFKPESQTVSAEQRSPAMNEKSDSQTLSPELERGIDEFNAKMAQLEAGNKANEVAQMQHSRSPLMSERDKQVEDKYQKVLSEKRVKYGNRDDSVSINGALIHMIGNLSGEQLSGFIKRHSNDINLVMANQEFQDLSSEAIYSFLVKPCYEHNHIFNPDHIDVLKDRLVRDEEKWGGIQETIGERLQFLDNIKVPRTLEVNERSASPIQPRTAERRISSNTPKPLPKPQKPDTSPVVQQEVRGEQTHSAKGTSLVGIAANIYEEKKTEGFDKNFQDELLHVGEENTSTFRYEGEFTFSEYKEESWMDKIRAFPGRVETFVNSIKEHRAEKQAAKAASPDNRTLSQRIFDADATLRAKIQQKPSTQMRPEARLNNELKALKKDYTQVEQALPTEAKRVRLEAILAKELEIDKLKGKGSDPDYESYKPDYESYESVRSKLSKNEELEEGEFNKAREYLDNRFKEQPNNIHLKELSQQYFDIYVEKFLQ